MTRLSALGEITCEYLNIKCYPVIVLISLEAVQHVTSALLDAPGMWAISICQFLYTIPHLWINFYDYYEQNAHTATT